MRPNAYIFEADSFHLKVYSASETVDLFGQDYLDDYGHHIPEDILKRYQRARQEMEEVQKELSKILNKKRTP